MTQQENRFALFGAAGFLILGLPRVLLHEMWRDECGPWMVAASPSLPELLSNTVYDGHPSLWYVAVWLVRQVVDHPMAMQLLHLGIATGFTLVLLRWAPWSRWVRLLIAGSYFLFFEYTILARTYALGVLFLWGFCALVGSRRHVEMRGGFLAAGGLLFLLAQTNVFATILTLAAVIWLMADWLWNRASPREAVWRRGVAVALALGGVALAVADMVPPPDSGFLPEWRLTWNPVILAESLGSLERAYLPLPQPGLAFWDTTVLDPWLGIRVALAGALLLAFGWVLRRRPIALVFWIAATLGILTFLYIKIPGHLRHHGHIFLALLAALWLAAGETPRDATKTRKPVGTALLLPLLAIQLAAGVYASWMDLREPFSSSKKAARFIAEQGLDHRPLAGHPDHTSHCVAMWLDREMYFPLGDRVGTWVRFDKGRREALTEQAALDRVRRRAHELGEPVVFVTGYHYRPVPPGVEELYRPGPAIVHEVWAVYRVSPTADAR